MSNQSLSVRVIDGPTVTQLLSMGKCVDLMREAMALVSSRRCQLPLRWGLPLDQGMLGIMPGSLADPACFGVKMVSLFPGNSDLGLSSHMGAMLLFESTQGRPLALLNAAEITRIRTAAASAVATDLLCPSDAKRLTVLGTGEQARAHLESMCCVRSFEKIVIWGRDPAKAVALAESFGKQTRATVVARMSREEAVAKAEVICTTTAADSPILFGSELSPGMHLNIVGSSIPSKTEIDSEAVRRSRYFVDYMDSTLAQAGELQQAVAQGVVTQAHVEAEIGEVLLGHHPGRRGAKDISLYRSLGVAAQDLSAAHFVYQQALKQDKGTAVSL